MSMTRNMKKPPVQPMPSKIDRLNAAYTAIGIAAKGVHALYESLYDGGVDIAICCQAEELYEQLCDFCAKNTINLPDLQEGSMKDEEHDE